VLKLFFLIYNLTDLVSLVIKKMKTTEKVECRKLRQKYRCEPICKELNELIKNITNLVIKEGEGYRAPSYQFEQHRDLLFSHLYEKTDLKDRLNNLKVSDSSLGNLLEIFYKLRKTDENILTDKLMEFLEVELTKIKKRKVKTYKFLTLLNIQKFRQIDLIDSFNVQKEFNIYRSILELFNIKRVTLEDYFLNIDKKDKSETSDEKFIRKVLKAYESSWGEIIEINVKARDYGFAFKEANMILDLFFGFLSWVRYGFVTFQRYGYIEYSIEEINSISYIVLKNNKLFGPSKFKEYHITSIMKDVNELSLSNVVDLKIREKDQKFRDFITIVNKIQKNRKKNKLWKILQEILRLYHAACTEKSLHYSFLKFWMVAEKILRKIRGRSKDEELLTIMAKVLKISVNLPIEEFIEKRIKFLYNKRNKLVHEGKFETISQEDRNISKLIADSTLRFYIDYLLTFQSVNEYNFLIQNISKNIEDIKRYSEILDFIEKDKEEEKILQIMKRWLSSK